MAYFFDRPSILALRGPADRSRLLEYPSARDILGKCQTSTKIVGWEPTVHGVNYRFRSESVILEEVGEDQDGEKDIPEGS
jgi:hypothetical protein